MPARSRTSITTTATTTSTCATRSTLSALYDVPGRGPILGGWSIAGIVNARSGIPVPVLIQRNDIVYVDGAGNVFNNAAADRTAVVNTPGGGSSRNQRRPDLIPGVDPFVKSGGLLFLNPAAFATPRPGTFGNLTRNQIHGPGFKQADLMIAKHIGVRNGPNVGAACRDLQHLQRYELRRMPWARCPTRCRAPR